MELLTITEAAAAAGVSDRTLRKYDRAGRISRVEGPDGRPHYRREEVESLRRAWPGSEGGRKGSEGFGSQGSERVGTDRKESFRSPDNGPLNGASHDVSPAAAILAAVERERDTLAQQVGFLQAQLDARTQAEEQLRVMLVRLEQTNAQLAATLVQKALPPASTGEETKAPRRIRWWPWRRHE